MLLRSSWGSQWGDNGNGWLPAAFIRKQLARDFWSIVSDDWMDSGELLMPSIVETLERPVKKRT
jgi:C1A family cysteine protease